MFASGLQLSAHSDAACHPDGKSCRRCLNFLREARVGGAPPSSGKPEAQAEWNVGGVNDWRPHSTQLALRASRHIVLEPRWFRFGLLGRRGDAALLHSPNGSVPSRLRRWRRRFLPTGGRQGRRGHGWVSRTAASLEATVSSDRRSARSAGPWMGFPDGCVAGGDAFFRPEVGKVGGAMDGPPTVQKEVGPAVGETTGPVAAIEVWVFGGGNSR